MAGNPSWLVFEVNGRPHAIPSGRVAEVIQRSPLTPVANAPAHLLGVTTLRGVVLPVVDVQPLLGHATRTELDERSCFVIALVADGRGGHCPVGLAVSKVLGTRRFDESALEPAPRIGGLAQAPHVRGFGRSDGELALLLELDALFEQDVDGLRDAGDTDGQGGPLLDRRVPVRKIRLFVVRVGGHGFGFPLGEIRRIVATEALSRDDEMPAVIAGTCSVDAHRIGVVDLATLLGADAGEATEYANVVVSDAPGFPLGFAIGDIGILQEIEETAIQSDSALARSTREGAERTGFVETAEGVIEVLSFGHLLSEADRARVATWHRTLSRLEQIGRHMQKPPEETLRIDPALARHARAHLVVRAADGILGIPNALVREVMPFAELVEVTRTEPHFAGVLDVRGTTHPVMDLPRRLGLGDCVRDPARSCIVLVDDHDGRTGLLVDEVLGLWRLDPAWIGPRETVTVLVHPEIVAAAAHAPEGDVALLDVPALLRSQERSAKEAWDEVVAAHPDAQKRLAFLDGRTAATSA